MDYSFFLHCLINIQKLALFIICVIFGNVLYWVCNEIYSRGNLQYGMSSDRSVIVESPDLQMTNIYCSTDEPC